MKKPLLTVCLITYNHVRYIRQAIDSILQQETDFTWTLIVADDSSTDGTQDILKQYQKKHPDKIKIIFQPKNVGPEKNWMSLLKQANSEFVLYCEGDDYFTDNKKLQIQLDYLQQHEDYTICFHPVKVIYSDNSKPDELFPSDTQLAGKTTFVLADLLKGNFMQANSVMYRWRFKDKDIGSIFPSGIIPGDWFLHVLHANEGKIGFIDREMAVYRRHEDGIWWSGLSNPDSFWVKYGYGHLALYDELLRLYGEDKQYRSILLPAIVNMCNQTIEVDAKLGTKIIESATQKYPNIMSVFMKKQYEILVEEKHLHDEARNEITHLKHELSESSNSYENKLHEVLNSRSFKTGYLVLHPEQIPTKLRTTFKRPK